MATETVRVIFLGNAASALRSTRQMEASFRTLGLAAKLAATAIGVAVVGGLVAATHAALDFDAAMRNVNTIARLSEDQFKSLEAQVLSLAKTTGQAPVTLAQGLYDIVSSGFDASEGLKVLEASAKAATAGLTDTATATKAVVAVLNAYHLSADQASTVSDVLFQIVNKGVLTFEELSQQIGDVLPAASALKVPLTDIGGALATVTLHGVNAAEAATQVKQLLVSMLKPSTGLADAFQKLGYESGQVALKQLGLTGVVKALSKAADGNNALIADWFPNVRALAGFLGLSGKNLKTFTEQVKAMNPQAAAAGATSKAFAEQGKSISVQWARAKASLIAAAIPIGELFFPALIKAAEGVAALANAIQRNMPLIRRIFAESVDAMSRAWEAVGRPVFIALQRVAERTVDWFRAHWPEIRSVARSVFNYIKTNVVPVAVAAFNYLKTIAASVVQVIRDNWPQIKATVSAVFQAIRPILAVLIAQMKVLAAVAKALAPIVSVAFGVMAKAIELAARAITPVLNGIAAAIEAVAGAAQHLLDLLSKIHIGGGSGGGPGESGGRFGGGQALGGPVSRGMSYLVGERGPELFVPNAAGRIVPNNQLGAAGGVTINFYGEAGALMRLLDARVVSNSDRIAVRTAARADERVRSGR